MKKTLRILIVIVMMLSITGCASRSMDSESGEVATQNESVSYSPEMDASLGMGMKADYGESREEAAMEMPPPIPPMQNDGESGEKIITTVELGMETTEFEKTVTLLEDEVMSHKGFIANSNISSNGGYYQNRTHRNAYLLVRIPKDKLNSFLDKTGEIAEVFSRSTSSEDMSSYYSDTQSKLQVLEVKESRILEMMKKATEMEDLITLENTLSDIIYQKENLTKNLKSIDNRVEYSTVSINLREVEKVVPPETIKTTFGEKVKNAFDDSLYMFKSRTQSMIIGFVYVMPTFIMFAAFIAIGLLIVKKANNKRKELKLDRIRKKRESEKETDKTE